MAGALRRLVYGQGTVKNWTVESTTTYNGADPADSPVAWGGDETDLERDFRATTNPETSLGALITFTPNVPDGFGGVLVKVSVTYTTESPRLELWTHSGSTWTLRRSILVSNIVVGARSGEAKVYDLLLSSQLDDVDQVWVTLKPTGAESMDFIALHPYGSCDTDINLPTCENFTGGCIPEIECLDPTTWVTNPDCEPPEPSEVDGSCEDCPFPDPNPEGTIEFPPFVLDIAGEAASQYTFISTFGWGYTVVCGAITPGTRLPAVGFDMIFGDIPTGGSVLVEYIPESTVQFNDDASSLYAPSTDPAVYSQEISAAGTMVWRIVQGTGFTTPFGGVQADSINGGLFPPPAVVPTYKFRFTPKGTLNVLQLFDILAFFWTTEIRRISTPC